MRLNATPLAMMINLLALILAFRGVSSFLVPGSGQTRRIHPTPPMAAAARFSTTLQSERVIDQDTIHKWTPQDLTKNNAGYSPIPDDDYVKKYQKKPERWPVEFFVIAHRRVKVEAGTNENNNNKKQTETQILVRKSANGTSKWGLGTGVPVTRWMLSSAQPPPGYQWSFPTINFDARNFPEFPKRQQNMKSWTYQKIDISEDAFNNRHATESDLRDPELEEYAKMVLSALRQELKVVEEMTREDKNNDTKSWEYDRVSLIKSVVDNANCLAAIQGTFRMSGLFAPLGRNAPDPAKIAKSMRMYTMFPQMPDPMQLPSTPPEELQKEIITRDVRMVEIGRDPHKDKYGRKYTHKSTSNVSNTIHGIYLTLDLTDLPGLDDVPAFDLFGTKEIKREWKSLEDLKVLDLDSERISTEDTKPTFISGFIVRQLVREGVISN